MSGKPTYDLQQLQQLVGQGESTRFITNAALEAAALLGLDEPHIVEAVLELTHAHFYKSMEAQKRPGLWQDVYHLEYRSAKLYIKLQIAQDGRAVVVQFKTK